MTGQPAGRDRIIFLAFCVLEEAIEATHAGPLPPSMPVRLALATLFAMSNGERESYDMFWKTVSDPGLTQWSEEQRAYIRTSYARSQMAGIARTLGFYLTVDLSHRIKGAVRGAHTDHAVFAALVRQATAKWNGEKAISRQGRECRLSD